MNITSIQDVLQCACFTATTSCCQTNMGHTSFTVSITRLEHHSLYWRVPIPLGQYDGRLRAYRSPGESFSDPWLIERHAFGGNSVTVCGGITAIERTTLQLVNRKWQSPDTVMISSSSLWFYSFGIMATTWGYSKITPDLMSPELFRNSCNSKMSIW